MENILSCNLIKNVIYSRDSNFLCALQTLFDLLPHTTKRDEFLWNHGALLFRPEAVVARRCRLLLLALREHGFVPVCARLIHLDPAQIRLLWRYQLNVMTLAHVNLLTRLLHIQPSIYILLKDYTDRVSAPATTHLTYLKGPTVNARRQPLHLRSLAGPAVANSISYIHAPDDPADLLREASVFFQTPFLRDVLAEAIAGVDRTSETISLLGLAERYSPEIDLSDINLLKFQKYASSNQKNLRLLWAKILFDARQTKPYIDGETYNVHSAIIPDSKEYIAPLDNHLIFPDIRVRGT